MAYLNFWFLQQFREINKTTLWLNEGCWQYSSWAGFYCWSLTRCLCFFSHISKFYHTTCLERLIEFMHIFCGYFEYLITEKAAMMSIRFLTARCFNLRRIRNCCFRLKNGLWLVLNFDRAFKLNSLIVIWRTCLRKISINFFAVWRMILIFSRKKMALRKLRCIFGSLIQIFSSITLWCIAETKSFV